MKHTTRRRSVRESAKRYIKGLLGNSKYPQPWIRATLKALRTGDYSEVAKLFRQGKFIGPQGHFIIVGPYAAMRNASREVAFSGVMGRVLSLPALPSFDEQVNELFGPIRKRIPQIIPVRVTRSFGNLCRSFGEGFIVPSWDWEGGDGGHPLNNMTLQRERFEKAFECIRRIFDKESAETLIRPLADTDQGIAIQHKEYSAHERGHETGIGLPHKLSNALLPTYWDRGVEEWRADGVGLELVVRTLPSEDAASIIASNFLTRFGLDAHRQGGLDRDHDVVVSALTLEHLFRSDALTFENGKLAFKDTTPSGLIKATELLRAEAVNLTREEMKLKYETGLWRLYSSFGVPKTTEAIFNGLIVEPCRGVFEKLR